MYTGQPKRLSFVYLLLSLLLSGNVIRAQESIHLASLTGRVTDPGDAVVEGAKVTARHAATNHIDTAFTDNEGRFRFPLLKAGLYEVQVLQPGFADALRTLTLTVGSAFSLPITLDVQAAQTDLIVRADAVLVETNSSQTAGTITQTEVQNLPLNGRHYLDLALLVPGVSPTNTGSNQLFAETSAVPGQGLSIGSQRNFSNNYIVDGLSANDDAAGLSGIFYGLDVVQEFQVVTAGGQAEFGRALGGYITMVTKSGTNQLHGSLYGFFRNQRFNAANPLSHAKLPSTQAQYGATLGGPLRRDRTFYFGNFEQRRLQQSGLITIAPADVQAINERLDATGYLGSHITTGLYGNPVHMTNVLSKADHQLSARDQLSVRYSLYDVDSSNSRGAGALNAVTASSGLRNRDQTAAVSNVMTLSANTVNETRGQFTYSSLDASPTDLTGPAVSIAGVASFGRLANSPTGRVNKLYEVTESLSHQAGAHALRAGVDLLYNGLDITFPRAVRGSYAFSSLANFLQGVYNNAGFTQTFGPTAVSQNNLNVGGFAQDEWRVTPRLTLNLGLRYDLQTLKTIRTDTNNIAPRAGFAWTPTPSRRTVIRGSYGLFYDRIPLRALANALLSSGNTTVLSEASQVSVSLSPTQTGAPLFPNILNAVPAAVLPNFTTMDRGMQNAYSVQGSIGVEQQIGAKSVFSAGYQHARGLHLIVSLNRNAPTCTAAGSNNGCRPNSAYANNNQYSPRGDSRYDALQLSFVQRPSAWGSYRVSYTYSKALNNVGEFFFSSPLNNDVWLDYGRSDDDQRHRLVADATIHTRTSSAANTWQQLTHNFQFSAMLQYYSALPLNITTGTTTVQGSAARPIVNGAYLTRNAGTGPDSLNVNARVSRSFRRGEHLRVEAIAEAFNLFNHRNDLTRNATFGPGAYPASPAPSFGQTTAVQEARTMQFALRVSF